MKHDGEKVDRKSMDAPGTWADRRVLLRLLMTTGLALLAPVHGVPGARAAEEKPQEKPQYVNKALLEKNPGIKDMVLGRADAPITIVEYASATCPHCANFHIHEWPIIRKEYVETGKVRFIFREFPLDQVALAAFMLARCAAKGDVDKYFAVLGMIMKTQREWVREPRKGLLKIMRLAGMDEKAFDACLKDRELAKRIANSARNASRDFGVNSVPMFFINARKLGGRRSIDEYRQVIEEELKRAGASGEGAKAAKDGDGKAAGTAREE